MGTSFRLLAIAAVCSFISACAIFSPQVHDSHLFDAKYAPQAAEPPKWGKPGTVAKEAVFAGDLAVAIDDANAQSTAYFKASGAYSRLRNQAALGAGLTGISALILGVAGNGSQDLRIGLAGASATILGLAGYYDNRPRQLVYLAGASAIACTVTAQRPLLVTKDRQQALSADVVTLRGSIAQFVKDLDAKLARSEGQQLYTLEKGLVVQEAANTTLGDAAKFQKGVDTAGIALREKVKQIVATVDAQVVKTDPDLQEVQKMIGGVGAALAKPQTGAVAVTPEKNLPVSSAGGDWLDLDVAAMITATDLVRAHLAEVTVAADVNGAMARCQVPEIPGALRVDPDETAHSVTKVPTTLVYSIRGGMLPVSAGLSGEFPADAFKVEQTTVNSTIQISVTVAVTAKGHSATLNIGDASGGAAHHVSIDVSASAEEAQTPVAVTPQANTGKKNVAPKTGASTTLRTTPATTLAATTPASPDALTAQRLALLRRELDVKTGAGSPTITSDDEAALRAFAAKNSGMEFDLKRSAPLYQAILASARAKAELLTPNAEEAALIQGNAFDGLRKECGLPAAVTPAASMDRALRDKIFDFEEQAQLGAASDPVIDGRVDTARLTAMLAAHCKAP